jgi:hypothetical protein
MNNDAYVQQSLELNLFYLRIMKEHAYLMATSFPPQEETITKEALTFNTTFNELLNKTLELAAGIVDIGEDAVTDFTLSAEEKTARLTGIPIDTAPTKAELKLPRPEPIIDDNLTEKVNLINLRALSATRNFIRFKTKVLNGILTCDLYSTIYPLMHDHLRREAIGFVEGLNKLQGRTPLIETPKTESEELAFWNQIMAEHAEFLRGYLDPSEDALISSADEFVQNFEALNKKLFQNITKLDNFGKLVKESRKLTKDTQAFNTQGLTGMLKCEVKSIMVPLLSDHVLRETNHYLKKLEHIKRGEKRLLESQ